jgi:hypothetical protein
MPFEPTYPDLRVLADGKWATVDELTYHGATEEFDIPRGMITDLASVPGFLWWFFPPYGKAITLAAILHDHLLSLVAQGVFSSRDADAIFRRVLREGGARFTLRWAMWTGVRWGAAVNPKRGEVLRDLPLMIAWSIPLAVPILIASPFVLLAKAIVWPFTRGRVR